MSIVQPKVKSDKKADKFISGAPDAHPHVAGIPKGKKRQISLTIKPELLMAIDEISRETGQTRAGLIGMAIYRLVKRYRMRAEAEQSMSQRT
jgi:hypothetical protein